MIGILKKLFGGADSGTDQDTKTKAAAKSAKKSAPAQTDYPAFVEFVVRRLVNNPDAVRLETSNKEGEATILIHCEKSDIAKVIGKRGRTISAIRLLVGGAASRNNEYVKVDVVD